MMGFRDTCIWVLLVAALCAGNARAWDQHHYLTESALKGIELRDPELWKRLNTPIEVHPVEELMAKAFGEGCGWDSMRDNVLEGLGKDYAVKYVEGATYRYTMDWEKGFNFLHLDFLPHAPDDNSEALGRTVTPLEVLTVYSDEPDWAMDVDVPRLKDIGITKGIVGTGTMVLRHFWYEETKYGVDLNKGQELDRRMQLLYELSLVAFSVDEPYWGYRYLAQALHYLEDLTQPFHIEVIPNPKMIFKKDFVQAELCQIRRKLGHAAATHGPDKCSPEDTVSHALVKSGWLEGSFHGLYEDFARGMMSKDVFGTQELMTDRYGTYERYESPAPLSLPRDGAGLLQLHDYVLQVHDAIHQLVNQVGTHLYNMIGFQLRNEPELVRDQLQVAGTSDALGYRLGTTTQPELLLPLGSEARAQSALVQDTHALLLRASIWVRQLTTAALETQASSESREVSELRDFYTGRCAARSLALH